MVLVARIYQESREASVAAATPKSWSSHLDLATTTFEAPQLGEILAKIPCQDQMR